MPGLRLFVSLTGERPSAPLVSPSSHDLFLFEQHASAFAHLILIMIIIIIVVIIIIIIIIIIITHLIRVNASAKAAIKGRAEQLKIELK